MHDITSRTIVPSIADQVAEQVKGLMGNLSNDLSSKQAQSTSDVQAFVRQCFLEMQREVVDLKKEIIDMRLQLERLRNGY